ncbi:MAG: putative Tic20 family protein [Verrucomicrobiales bacterium]|jgi:uncharacterized Tic20 family protein
MPRMDEAPPPSPQQEFDLLPPDEFGEVTDGEASLAVFAHILGIFTFFVGPLVIRLLQYKKSKFVTHHSTEALNFWIMIAGIMVVSVPLTKYCIGIITGGLAFVAGITFSVVGAVEARNKEPYHNPAAYRFVS